MNVHRPTPQANLTVWDLPTRLYHWLQAAAVAGALATGFFAPEWWLSIHVQIAYLLGALIVFRLVWGIFGSHYSRFSSLAISPRQLVAQIAGLIRGRPPRFLGHNPLGSVMIVTLIATLAGLLATGLVALGGEEGQGPLAAFFGFSAGSAARLAHELLAFAVIGLIALHLLGVAVESMLTRESLTVAMITGRKRAPVTMKALPQRPARRRAAALAVALAGAGLFLAGAAASRMPASGVIALPALDNYQAECGACHEAYHPSLLPRASWAQLAAGLDDHFGEDASLDDATTREIAAWLDAFASEAWDTEVANRLRSVDTAQPMRMTATPFWRRKHAGIATAVFESASVRGAGNCSACHKDAASGRFDDQMIAIPSTGPTLSVNN